MKSGKVKKLGDYKKELERLRVELEMTQDPQKRQGIYQKSMEIFRKVWKEAV